MQFLSRCLPILLLAAAGAHAAPTALADAPLFSSTSVPGNLALALSVEWPTALRAAHTSAYSSASTYLGYFDPNKCYTYRAAASELYFDPTGLAANRRCSGKWSGNFMNWAATQTIDPFRWALTGGYRAVDTTQLTLLQKAYHTGTGGFPDRGVPTAEIAGATPLGWNALNLRVSGLGFKMRFTGSGSLDAAGTPYDPASPPPVSAVREVVVRVKVCDAGAGLESNCKAYGSRWKPEGLIQAYASRFRFSAFGYLNDSSTHRDGGVLRARQKFVGPSIVTPGQPDSANPAAEWDPATGIFVDNPDASDAARASGEFGVTIPNSGVINYLNKFGQIAPYGYKSFDPASEMYYSVLRYYKHLGNVDEYTDMGGASAATRSTWLDSFPVITDWDDPILYACQKNAILGIGDVNTWNDKNLPGRRGGDNASEPPLPAKVAADRSVDARAATNQVGVLQGLSATLGEGNSYSGRNNSAFIAGLAYDANTRDLRPDDAASANTLGKQTVQTYWVDVLETGFLASNQYYLAGKYGSFDVPANYDADTNTTPLPLSWWSTSGDVVGTQPRPDGYFTAGRPDTMVSGLTKAFATIARKLDRHTTLVATARPQLDETGNASFTARYSTDGWTGDVTAQELSYDAQHGTTSFVPRWNFSATLAAQAAGTGWNGGRNIVTWNDATRRGVPLRSGSISAGQQTALPAAALDWLRGDRSREASGTLRRRNSLVGDIVNAKLEVVGPPAAPLADATNPGYRAFKWMRAQRPAMVYAAANDGMLHGIDAASGREVFGYVPGVAFRGPNGTPGVDGLAALADPNYLHRYYVDATPRVYDVDFGGVDWRSILIGGLGKGGRAYYAIDVTDPAVFAYSEATAAGRVLWEFTDPHLGYSYGEPLVVKTRKDGWVVILTSGYANDDGGGYFYVVHPRTGALLQRIPTGAGSVANPAGLAHPQGFLPDRTDGTADAVYAGDLLGNVWRLDLSAEAGAYPAPVRIATLTDRAGNPQPVTARPLIEVQQRRRWVMAGTGRLLAPSDIGARAEQSFWAIVDGTASQPALTAPVQRSRFATVANPAAGVVVQPEQAGWVLDFGSGAGGLGWRYISDDTATVYDGNVVFAAMAPDSDPCRPAGSSRIYALNFSSGKSALADGAPWLDAQALVTDLRVLRFDSKTQTLYGKDNGEVGGLDPFRSDARGLRLVNWRELPLAD